MESAKSGLSPRVRGNQRAVPSAFRVGRSIPARAGEPPSPAASREIRRVYPRACGGTDAGRAGIRRDAGLSPRVRGNPSAPSARSRHQGLSPRVRGNLGIYRGDGRVEGSIPARAGEPRSAASSSPGPAVYPRACGGTTYHPRGLRICAGLSPRVRGNHRWGAMRRAHRRSIPARAGEPVRSISAVKTRAVYPRACGGT